MATTPLQTFVFINGIMGCLMGFVLVFLRHSYPASIKGLASWSLVPILAFVASLLYGMQGSWHHLITTALPNSLLLVALLMLLNGTYEHFGRRIPFPYLAVPVVLALPYLLWSSSQPELYVQRLIVISSFSAVVCLAQLPVLWQHRRGSFAAHFMMVTLLLMAGVMAARAITAGISPPPGGIYGASSLQAIYLATYGFGILLLSISAILLSAEQLRNELERLLRHDALTGALARQASLDLAAQYSQRSVRQRTPLSLLLMDLDHFKHINDNHGHQAGDAVLTHFVRCVRTVLPVAAEVGRYGGEEFLAILPDTSTEQAAAIAERIRLALQAQEGAPKVTVSIGVSTLRTEQAETLESAIARADRALYTAKHRGRDRIELG